MTDPDDVADLAATEGPEATPSCSWARLKLWALALSTAACLAVAHTPDPDPPFEPPAGSTCDREVFERIVARVRGGDGFYDATQVELRTHGYPTRSVFNWRTPVYAWLLGGLPSGAYGRALLIAAAVALLAMACGDMIRESGVGASAVGGTLLVGSTVWVVSDGCYLFTELWAGIAIALSVCLLARGRTTLGVVVGLFALFDRELALPYVVVSLGLAAWHGRRREAIAWGVGLAVYAAFLGGHALVVASRLTAADQSLPGGWIRFGGVRFLLATTGANVFLMGLPTAVSAVVLPLSVFGLAHARDETGRRVGLTLGLYLLAFSVVGAPFNYYWGFIDAPLIALGVARAPSALMSTLRAARLGEIGQRLIGGGIPGRGIAGQAGPPV